MNLLIARSGRVLVYLYAMVIIAIAFALAGDDAAALSAYLVVLILGALGVGRCLSAARSARRWRSGQQGS